MNKITSIIIAALVILQTANASESQFVQIYSLKNTKKIMGGPSIIRGDAKDINPKLASNLETIKQLQHKRSTQNWTSLALVGIPLVYTALKQYYFKVKPTYNIPLLLCFTGGVCLHGYSQKNWHLQNDVINELDKMIGNKTLWNLPHDAPSEKTKSCILKNLFIEKNVSIKTNTTKKQLNDSCLNTNKTSKANNDIAMLKHYLPSAKRIAKQCNNQTLDTTVNNLEQFIKTNEVYLNDIKETTLKEGNLQK